ncbi:hypothetical protein GOBAR_DD33137 [Gossypium barbadense]|nr:hypothetical protein GOBAR_DD33137 [Gossypium barbadense]
MQMVVSKFRNTQKRYRIGIGSYLTNDVAYSDSVKRTLRWCLRRRMGKLWSMHLELQRRGRLISRTIGLLLLRSNLQHWVLELRQVDSDSPPVNSPDVTFSVNRNK